MKTNNNYIFKFETAYSFQYRDYDEILLAWGTLWPIIKSDRKFDWKNDKFTSMDKINKKQRKQGWFFMTNLIEPVFLLHSCVSLDRVKDNYPTMKGHIPDWRTEPSSTFYHHLTLNMHNLILESDDHKQMELPCGPVYKCKKHDKSRCWECPHTECKHDFKYWKVGWRCNESTEPHFMILDSKNGLVMTLMETVPRDSEFVY
ncbi:MAG: hypothetical protein ACPG2Y_03190 [Acholeplasmataceae bacterium]